MIFLLATIILLPLIIGLSIASANIKDSDRQDKRVTVLGGLSGSLGVLYLVIASVSLISIDYAYSNEFESHWNLGVKASTIQLKRENIKKFYDNIISHKHQFRDSSAVFMRTPDNSLDQNLVALKSLVDRLDKISGMDENSLAYQTAMQQITGQEQDEASSMLRVFERCYAQNKSILFSWLGALLVGLGFIFGMFGFNVAFGD